MEAALARVDAHAFLDRYAAKLVSLKKRLTDAALAKFRISLPDALRERAYGKLLARLDEIIANPGLATVHDNARTDRRVIVKLAAILDRTRANVRAEASKTKKTSIRYRGIPATIAAYDAKTDNVSFSRGRPVALTAMRPLDLKALFDLDPGAKDNYDELVALLLTADGESKLAAAYVAKASERSDIDHLEAMLIAAEGLIAEAEIALIEEEADDMTGWGDDEPVKKPGAPGAKEEPEPFPGSIIRGYDDSFLLQGKWAEGRKYYRDELTKVLLRPKPALLEAQRLLYALDVCELFPAIAAGVPSPDAHALAQWLLKYPQFVRKLIAAIHPADDRAGVFRVLHVLKTKCPLQKPAFADLMVAFAVVYDARVKNVNDAGQTQPVVSGFRHYVRNSAKFTRNPKRVPWALLKFVVAADLTAPLISYIAADSISTKERRWAFERYLGRFGTDKVYGSIRYDMPFAADGKSKRRTRLLKAGYTLKNIKRFGGICGDQAYFATHVAKSVARPALMFVASDINTGIGHVWVAVIKWRRGKWVWVHGGRYPRFSYAIAQARDPQTGAVISDRDSWLESRNASLSETRRQRARVCLKAALLLDAQSNYAEAIKYLYLALRLNPYCAESWKTVARYCAEKKLRAEAAGALYRTMLARFERHPELVKQVLDQIRVLVPEADIKRHVALLDLTYDVYRKEHPEFAVALRIEKANYYRANKRPKAAMAVYNRAVSDYQNKGIIIVTLLGSARDLYRAEKANKQYLKLAERGMRVQKGNRKEAMKYEGGFEQSAYYKLAKLLRDLHAEAGNKKKAAYYEKMLKRDT